MILEPNPSFSEPFETDMSGLDLVAEGSDLRTFTVNAVEANSPAAEAHLREEDVLVAIDGRPAADFNLDQLTSLFTHEGKEYELTVRRGQEILKVKMKLRRLI
jgi:S1-C subfamily serine protease